MHELINDRIGCKAITVEILGVDNIVRDRRILSDKCIDSAFEHSVNFPNSMVATIVGFYLEHNIGYPESRT